MAIIIGRRPEHEYTRVPNAWLRDPDLSFRGKGLLAYLLSHRSGYRLTVERIVADFSEGSSAIYGALRELAKLGYVRREQRRGEGGKVGEVDYYVTDAPGALDDPNESAFGLPASGLPASGKPESGDDQGKRDVLPGQTAFRFTARGKSASIRRTKNLEEQEDSLSAREADPPAAAAPADREREEHDKPKPGSPNALEHRLIAARGVPTANVEAVRAVIAGDHRVRGRGWWVTADGNGTLDAAIAAAVTALSSAGSVPVAGRCGWHPWEPGGGPCAACAGEANGREPAAVLPSLMSSGRVIRSAADQRVADGAVLYAKYAALDAAEAVGEGPPG